MAKRSVILTFPEDLITEPVIYNLGLRFDVVTNILRAKVEKDRGWVLLQLDGQEENIERGLEWIKSKGVTVEPATINAPEK